MREDTAGLFWDDTPPPKIVKPPPPKRIPPPRTWEDPGYLPGLEEARRFPVNLFTTEELLAAANAKEVLVFDTECFGNYWLIAFASVVSGKVIYFEMIADVPECEAIDNVQLLQWIIQNFVLVGFNSDDYDLPMLALALSGLSCGQLKACSDRIIVEQIKSWLVLRTYKVKSLRVDHIDLIGVCPLQASLKIYGGRLHIPRMQELPFNPNITLNDDQVAIVRWYCVNDLTATAFLFVELKPQLELRLSMSQRYGVDLRSKSDSQIAETILNHELTRINYAKPMRPEIEPGTMFNYNIPDYIEFETEEFNNMLEIVRSADFIVEENGYTQLPKELTKLAITLNEGVYRMGIGGLHSSETCITHIADENELIMDRDVASYYPSIILNQELFPKHLGRNFLTVYKEIVDRRLAAKKSGNKVEADTLKITINGSFGKLGNKWSTLYAPDLLIQVTLTGQLTLLMLIERFELAGIRVISANTDGVITRFHRERADDVAAIVCQWETDTGFKTEETFYRGIFCRDVNNYIAVKLDGGVKVKGEYAERGSAGDSRLSKNPASQICNDAVLAFLQQGTPIAQTIRTCSDVRRFVTVRTVKGGAVKNGVYLGKAIRWIYTQGEGGEIVYALNGNRVPKSEGAFPLMDLPSGLPPGIDFDRYERDALSILTEVGYPSMS